MIAAAMGWIGTVGSISAYLLMSRGRWQSTSLRYSALNGLAGLLAGAASVAYGAWPSAASNLLWSCIALQAGIATVRERRRRAAAHDAWPLAPTDASAPVASSPGVELALVRSAAPHAC